MADEMDDEMADEVANEMADEMPDEMADEVADEMSEAACEESTENISKSSGKIQRSVSSMLKQMELTEEENEYRMETFGNRNVNKQYKKYTKFLKCTKCNSNFKEIINEGKAVGTHPLLGVLLCDACCDYYGDGHFSLDSEGEDKYCRWCGEGGTIFSCSKCICGFCSRCIKKHFGKQDLNEAKNDDNWVCYFCNPKPLWHLRSICSLAEKVAKIRKETLGLLKERGPRKTRRSITKDSLSKSSDSSGSCGSAEQKKGEQRPKRISKNTEEKKRDASSSGDDDKPLVSIPKRRGRKKKSVITAADESSENEARNPKRRGRKKALRITVTDESSENDARNPKKKVRLSDDMSFTSNLETIKLPLLEKLKSLWKLTQSTMEEGLKRCRERLMYLSKPENYDSDESLRKEIDELMSYTKEIMSPLSVVSSSLGSIGEDLKIDTAKDVGKILQSQESKLNRFEEEADMETSFDSDREAPAKVNAVKEKRKEKEGVTQERKVKEKLDEESEEAGEEENGSVSTSQDEEVKEKSDEESEGAGEDENGPVSTSQDEEVKEKSDEGSKRAGEDENGSVSTSQDEEVKEKSDEESEGAGEEENGPVSTSQEEGRKDGSAKKSTPAKPLLKVKSFAKMLDENLYDRKENNGNGNVSEKSPIVIDLMDVDSDEGECESSTEKKLVGEEESKAESSDKGGKKRSSRKETLKMEASSSKESRRSDNESLKNEGNSDQEEEEKPEVEKKREKKREKEKKNKMRKKLEEENKKKLSESGSEASETLQEEAKKSKQEMKEKKDKEKRQKKLSGKDKNCPSGDESEKNDSEIAKEKSCKEKVKSDSSSDQSSAGEEENRRITRSRNKNVHQMKASFAEFKQRRKKFLKSGKKKQTALDSSNSDDEKKEKSGKQKKRIIASSDEEDGGPAKDSHHSDEESSEKEEQKSESDVKSLSSSEQTSSDESSRRQVKRKRTRKKKTLDSSGEDSKEKKKGRKNIKKILKKDSLKLETKEALKNEEERKKRLKLKQALLELTFPDQKDFNELKRVVLDFDPVTKKPLVTVHKKLVMKLKPHQAMGIKFMWDNCFESVQRMEEDSGSGCILAHCMGLGKTLQVVTLVHTVMTHDLGLSTVLIVCPVSTVSNWMHEFETWLANIHTDPIMLYDLSKYKSREDRRFYLNDWHKSGGVLILSYDLFRNFTRSKSKSGFQKVRESALLDPGPDLVVCDEGHLLKNEDTALSKCMSRVRTSRRIILTGTPLQNNLIEYHCMVQFVKPNVLGTKKEFCNRFVNPITNGQFEDSTEMDVKTMKRRSHVLHSLLDGCIQRFDYSVLTPFLPEKYEYVLSIELTEKQADAYRHYIHTMSARYAGSTRTTSLFNDYHGLQKIWTHPRAIIMQREKESLGKDTDSEGSLKDFVVSSDEESTSSKSDGSYSSVRVAPKKRITRASAKDPEVVQEVEENVAPKKNWWDDFYDETAFDDLRESNKLILLFDLLKHCGKVKDKLLVFSQSLYSLDLIEYFLGRISENRDEDNEQLCGHRDTWVLGSDYFRLDGTTSNEKRTNWCRYFNKESNTRARLFLLSTKAGGLGINLYGANRVVIFDAAWNPSHDLQSIFRIYRFGQKKTCYVYRFLSEATMEEKIYERQVTKLSLAHRVVDEHQIERHYTMGNLQALYTFNPTPKEARKVPILPKDPVLAELLASHKELIVRYHEHDSLLENKQEEELSEEERKVAWKEYEEEKAQKAFCLDPVDTMLAQQHMVMLMEQARCVQGMHRQPGTQRQSAGTAQSVINPMYLQYNPNIPVALYQRGMKVGLSPLLNESMESYYARIISRESWLQSEE